MELDDDAVGGFRLSGVHLLHAVGARLQPRRLRRSPVDRLPVRPEAPPRAVLARRQRRRVSPRNSARRRRHRPCLRRVPPPGLRSTSAGVRLFQLRLRGCGLYADSFRLFKYYHFYSYIFSTLTAN